MTKPYSIFCLLNGKTISSVYGHYADDEAAAREPLANIVMARAFELEGDAPRQEGAEALPRRAREARADRAVGKCMDVTNGATANGTRIQLWDCNGTGSQEWRWRSQTSIVNPQSGRCLDITGGSVTDGSPLDIWDCNGTPEQVWYLP